MTEPIGDEFQTERLSVSEVPIDSVESVWISQLKMINSGLRRGQGDATSANEMLASIKNGKMSLWVVHDGDQVVAVVVVSVLRTPTITKLMVHLIAGSRLGDWADLLQEKLLQCKDLVEADCIEASCRLGLAKYLTKKGWSKKAIIMELQ